MRSDFGEVEGDDEVGSLDESRATTPHATRRCGHNPGCSRPHRMCDAHHIIPWEEDGPTTLDNLILLCRRHHVHVHKHHLIIDMHTDGTVDFKSQPP